MLRTNSAPHSILGTTWWQSILLGIVLIIAATFVLRHAVAAIVVSAIAVGAALLAAGLFEAAQSFWAPHWGGVLWRLAVGGLYAVGGGALIADPAAASNVLTLAFAAALVASGAVRILLAVRYWERLGWLLSTSGMVGILGGLVIFLKWPLSGPWVFALAVGADLLLHGIWWVATGLIAREEAPPA
jgi:uncharacterized membrane protein HdeD (DUF308 family)